MDFTSPAFIADPYPVYSQLRQAGPLHSLMPGLWLATRYRVADAILRDARFGKDYLSGVARRYGPERSQNPVFATVNRFLLLMNPPEHTRLRALVSKAFGVKQAAELRRLTETAADRLIGDFYRDGRADLAAAFAYPLPMAVICALMGIRADDAQLFQQESQALVKVFELTPLNDADLKAAESAASTFATYFGDILASRRRRPCDGLVSLMLKAEEGQDRLTEKEIIANTTLLFMAGHETTANMIGNALLALFRHPEQLARLRDDWSLLPQAVNEALRYDSSVHLAARVALQDLDVDGVAVAKGDTVYINLGAANRDPEVFPDPDSFRIDRAATANPLSFGGGAHYCLGARLARIELETALAALLQRLPGLRLENLEAPVWRATTTVRGLESLWATWNP
ncbi:cytochrome P450 [Methylogaea oryzae]|uniref:Cytochrome P450 hydroxylase n=1 Tax=Methylogaea oryzae TaxID=1295382 RepID=A0A8D5AIE7_9GAMM|nr:cytochrome P450 [Methylogaea oryzae]BBL72448.1 cytochrome P450 hydroxylase [Methylogaea oryzae]